MSNYQRQRRFERREENQSRSLPQIKSLEVLTRELLTDDAKIWAESFARGNLTPTQLRKYYNEIKAIEAKIEGERVGREEDKDMAFKKYEPLFAMLKSRVAYDRTRFGKKFPDSFKKFIDGYVDKVRSFQEFANFKLLFESIVGFFPKK